MNTDQFKGQWGTCIESGVQQIEGSFDKRIGLRQEQSSDNCSSVVRAIKENLDDRVHSHFIEGGDHENTL